MHEVPLQQTLQPATEVDHLELFASLVAGDLVVEARGSQALLRMDWSGRSNARQPAAILAPCFETVLRRAQSQGCGIEAHFERLEFFNSSTVCAVLKFIGDARDQGTVLALIFDGELKWQALSFEALRSFELPDGLLRVRSFRPSVQ